MKQLKTRGEKTPEYFLGIELEGTDPNYLGGGPERNVTMVSFRRQILSESDPVVYKTCFDGGGIEVALLPVTPKWLTVESNVKRITSIVRIFDKLKLITDRSTSAGMHVHISKTAYDTETFLKLLDFLAASHDKISKFTGRTRNHHYSRSRALSNAEKNQIADHVKSFTNTKKGVFAKTNRETVGDNFLAINRKGYPTIEFRCFQATSDVKKFFANVEFVIACREFVYSKLFEANWNAFYNFVEKNKKDFKNLYAVLGKLGLTTIEAKKSVSAVVC